MPETIGLLVLEQAGFAGAAGFTVFGIAGAPSLAGIIGGGLLLGAAVGASALLTPSAGVNPQSGQITIRQARAARRRNYGIVKVGGALMFSETQGTRWQVIAISQGEIDGYIEHWMADLAVTLDGSNIVNNAYTDGTNFYVGVFPLTGTLTDGAFTQLVSGFPSFWTTAHQGKDIAKVLVGTGQPQSKDFTKVYPGGAPPVYRGVIRSSKIWDPRDPTQNRNDRTTWKFSENPVLIALDYHRHVDGMGLSFYRDINGVVQPSPGLDNVFFTSDAITQDWGPAADICDGVMIIADGTSTKRYTCGGGYELPTAPKNVLAAILSTCDGQTYQRPDGAIGIRVGSIVAPTVTISDQHVLSYAGFVNGSSGGISQVNVITAKFTARDLDFQEADADPWRDEVSISITGREETRSLDLTWVEFHPQARRLMKIASRRYNPTWTGTIVTDLDGLRAWGERFINLEIAELSIDDPFEIMSFTIDPGSMTIAIGVQSFDQSAYDWNPLLEEGTAPNAPDTTVIPGTISAPTSVVATPTHGNIAVTWATSGRLDTTPVLQYKLHSATDWLNGFADTQISGHISSLASGTYDIQVEFTVGSNTSGFTAILNIVVP
jgi:hypothetical protein